MKTAPFHLEGAVSFAKRRPGIYWPLAPVIVCMLSRRAAGVDGSGWVPVGLPVFKTVAGLAS